MAQRSLMHQISREHLSGRENQTGRKSGKEGGSRSSHGKRTGDRAGRFCTINTSGFDSVVAVAAAHCAPFPWSIIQDRQQMQPAPGSASLTALSKTKDSRNQYAYCQESCECNSAVSGFSLQCTKPLSVRESRQPFATNQTTPR